MITAIEHCISTIPGQVNKTTTKPNKYFFRDENGAKKK